MAWRGVFIVQGWPTMGLVQLKKYNPDKLDKSVVWTMGKNLDDGYRTVSTVENTHLKLDVAFRDIKKYGRVNDDANIVLSDWHGGNNQRWTIISYWLRRGWFICEEWWTHIALIEMKMRDFQILRCVFGYVVMDVYLARWREEEVVVGDGVSGFSLH
ncbi:ricin B lectin domain-containing protein [Tanacetum coccineum]|uniref:Ricin B lectin domain-containing protein n=1 Tax=Tanacetum coccineum TaxID=301880 RepID=A0ABQ5ATG6_9ASTR